MAWTDLIQDRDKHWALVDITNLWDAQNAQNFLTRRETIISQILHSKVLVRNKRYNVD
jgi:hypothetical protein